MRIAIAQMNSRPGDFSRTVSRMVELSHAASARGAELVVFPVPALTGPDPWSAGEEEGWLEDLAACMGTLSTDLACAALVPLVLASPAGPYHEAVLVADGRVTPLRLSAQLEDPPEGVWSVPGASGAEGLPIAGFTLEGLRACVVFDQDELGCVAGARSGADVVCYLESGCFCTDDETTSLAPSVAGGGFVADAANANAWIVAAGAVGGYESHVFCGGSFVMAPWGELAWAGPSFEEALGVVDVDPLSEGPLPALAHAVPYQRMDHLWGALALSIRDFVLKQGHSCVVVPLSGDLASCTVTALATDALGPTHVHAIICGARDASALADARSVARSLRVRATEVPDDGPLAAAAALGFALPSSSPDVPVVRRELFWATLRWAAAVDGALVLSPADKTGLALDPASSHVPGADFAPLGDVYRTDVAALVRRRSATSPSIPASVLDRLSLPEFLVGRGTSDEAVLSQVDACLLLRVERRLPASQVLSDQPDVDLASEVLDRLEEGERVRRSAACYPMLSERALFERRVQLGSAWRDHAREGSAPDLAEALLGLVSGAPAPRMAPPSGGSSMAGLSDKASREVEGILGMIQDMLADGSWQSGSMWGDGLFSEN